MPAKLLVPIAGSIPDGRLYVAELFGKIHAIRLDANKQVVSDEVIDTLDSRLTLGLTVDPDSTADDVKLWVAHSSRSLDNGEANSSTITRLSGSDLRTRHDVITGLPRAKANHAVNSLHFGADRKLYIAAGGNTGAGAPNTANTEFGTMAEQPLSAALLVADVRSSSFDGSCHNEVDIFGPPPCDVQRFATGLRNTYDFVFHSNGLLYGPDNGLGTTGSFRPSPTPPCKGTGSTTSWSTGGQNPGHQPDNLNLIEPGRYYGHPNPSRDECVFGDGRYQKVSPPSNYETPIGVFGTNKSANGIVEWRSDTFCGELTGDLLVGNYSVGDDVTRIRLSEDGRSVTSTASLVGGFDDPLPVAQAEGTLYVGEFGGNRVTALEPVDLGCWKKKEAAPDKVLDAGGTELDGRIYMVAGKTSRGHRSSVDVYDPGAGTWRSAASLPGPAVENPAVVARNGKLYAFGGSTAAFSGAVDNAAVFDPSTGDWSPLPAMPTARAGAGAGVIDGKIHVAGGMDANGASVDTLEVYDPTNGVWSSAPAMRTGRDNPGVAILDGKLYVFGGRTRETDGSTTNGTLTSVEMYDPVANAWSERAPMPTGRRAMVVGRLNGRAQLVGGEIRPDGATFDQNEEYDEQRNTWRVLKAMPTGRHGAVGATVGDNVYVIGGGPDGGASFTDVTEAFSFQK